MSDVITVANVTFAIGIIGVLFTIYSYFKEPQEKLEKAQAISAKEVDGKAALLVQQVQWEKELNERRFKELQEAMNVATNLAQNHIHTVDVKVDTLAKTIGDMDSNIGKELVRLSTIIEERFDKKIKV